MKDMTLHSERLTLTPTSLDDVDISIEMFTDPGMMTYTGGPMSEAAIHAGMKDWARRGGNGCIGIWVISDRSTGEKLGTVALLPIPIDAKDTDYSLVVPGEYPPGDIEIGYFIKRSAWGRGIASEAAKRIVKMAFEESPLTQVVATFDPNNASSQNVLEKCGFRDVGPKRCYGVEAPFFCITREDWLQQSDG